MGGRFRKVAAYNSVTKLVLTIFATVIAKNVTCVQQLFSVLYRVKRMQKPEF